MSNTIARQICNKCNKKNLCTWEYEGVEITKCKTRGCMKNTSSQPIQSTTLEFTDFSSYYRGISPQTLNFLGIKECVIGDTQIVAFEHINLDGTTDRKIKYPKNNEGKNSYEWNPKKTSNTSLFALDKCTDFDKPIIIVEGGEDCATWWELGYQSASLLSAGNDKDITLSKVELDYISKFKEIVLAIEDDIPGQKAKESLQNQLAHKIIRIVDLSPMKDSNDWIKDQDKAEELLDKLNSAKEVIPEGIVFAKDLDRKVLRQKPAPAYNISWPGLQNSLSGWERGCLYVLLAGATTGKSTFLRNEVYKLRISYPESRIFCCFFEESDRITPQLFIALDNNIPLGKLKRNPEILSEEMFNKSWDKLLNNDKLVFPNIKFKKDSDYLLKCLKYLVTVKKCDIIVIDHISYIIGRMSKSRQGERVDVDKLIYDLHDLAVEHNIVIISAAHITDSSNDDSWDKGKVPSLYSGRSSKVFAQAPDGVIALSRNNLNSSQCNILNVHCLKSRWDGKIGRTDQLIYEHSTGRLSLL